MAVAATVSIIAIIGEAVVIGAVAPAPAMMEVMVFMEAMLSVELTGFGRRRGDGGAAGCDKRGEGEGGNSGLDRHNKLLVEEDARLNGVGRVGAHSLRARVRDAQARLTETSVSRRLSRNASCFRPPMSVLSNADMWPTGQFW